MARFTVGVFDSGIGGLSVLQHIQTLLPDTRLVYFADSAHAPYGNKPAEFIVERSMAISKFLISQDVDAIVVACNTATSAAIQSLRECLPLPVIGMEPGVKPAVAATRSGVVGILATTSTLSGKKYERLVTQYQDHARIINQPCPGLVERIERGHINDSATRALLESYVNPLLEEGADALVLGCTHYPFLRGLIEELVGPDVTIIDTGPAIAKELQRRLGELDISIRPNANASVEYWTSGNVSHVENAIFQAIKMRVEVRYAEAT